MNDALEQAAAVDPEWAKKEGRRRLILGLLTFGVLVALAVGVPALVIGFHNGTEITQIQHSACQVDPAGAECQKAKVESSEAATLQTTCIPFFKAGYPCPKPGSTAAERQARRRTLRAHPVQGPKAANGGDATSNPSTTGHSSTGPSSGGPTGSPSKPSKPSKPSGNGGGHESRTPSSPAPSPPSSSSASKSSSSTTTTERTEVVHEPSPPAPSPPSVTTPTPTTPIQEAAGGLIKGAGHAVEEAAGTVNEAGKGVTCTVGLGC